MKKLLPLVILFSLFLSSSLWAQKRFFERGLAEVIMDGQNTGKNLVLHPTLPLGTMIGLRNPANGKSTTAKVVSRLPATGNNERLIVKISQSTYNALRASGKRFSVEVYPAPIIQKPQTIQHEVQAGETLYAISRKYKTTVAELKEWNDLESDQISPEQVLKIRPKK